MDRSQRIEQLYAAVKDRILVLDGGMGTTIQQYKLSEEDYRGERFADHGQDVKGNNELLSLTQPQIIQEIHKTFLEVGADIIETNTFSATSISQADYNMQAHARELNYESARLARDIADQVTKDTPEKPRFVVGALGPTNKTASISPDVNDPGFRAIRFEQLKDSYKEAAHGLIEGDVDMLMIETIFDTLNAKAAIFAVQELMAELSVSLPVMVSGTITDMSGRTLSGQTTEAFWYSVRHAAPFSVGLNCALGAEQLRPYVEEFSRLADTHLCAYPNAGLPNEMGEYDEPPSVTAGHLKEWAEAGFLNIAGGCCGITYDHVKAIAEAMVGVRPRVVPLVEPRMRLSGLEAFVV